jgi:DNA primase
MLSDDKIAEIRESVDLVALISEFVPLRRQGTRFVGLCPFHQEKTPSFGVSRGKSFYFCFGCQASGDAISFLRHVEGLSFIEAVERLAERSGIEIPRVDDPAQAAVLRARAQRERLAEIMSVAAAFFEEQLHGPQGALARAEISSRAIRPEVTQHFRLGYAPASWDALALHLTRADISTRDASEIGLIAPRRNGPGFYDRFRHRLMFPVADRHGRIIAFSGRALAPIAGEKAEDTPPAKYINSPEGPLYKKGHGLFGIHEARVALRQQGIALLCEGNFDLLSIHQAGFANVVAPLGTAFTVEQARLLRQFVEEAVVVFDGDGAGRKATRTAFALLSAAGIRAKAVRLPDKTDPDTFIRERGVPAFKALLEAATGMVDYLIDDAAEQATDGPSRALAIQSLGPLLQEVESPIERGMYVDRVASRFDIRDLNAVRQELRRGVIVSRQSQARRLEPPRPKPNAEGPGFQAPTRLSRKTTELPELQRKVLGAVLDHPTLLHLPEAQRLDGLLTDSDLRAIFRATARLVEERGEVDALKLLEAVAGNPACAWLGERLSGPPEFDADLAKAALRDGIPRLEEKKRDEERAQLRREIQLALRSGDTERAQELTRVRDELAKKRDDNEQRLSKR